MTIAEIIVDWLKHAFITKFNEIPTEVYQGNVIFCLTKLFARHCSCWGIPWFLIRVHLFFLIVFKLWNLNYGEMSWWITFRFYNNNSLRCCSQSWRKGIFRLFRSGIKENGFYTYPINNYADTRYYSNIWFHRYICAAYFLWVTSYCESHYKSTWYLVSLFLNRFEYVESNFMIIFNRFSIIFGLDVYLLMHSFDFWFAFFNWISLYIHSFLEYGAHTNVTFAVASNLLFIKLFVKIS